MTSASDAGADSRTDASPVDARSFDVHAGEASVTIAVDSTHSQPLPPRFSGVNSEQPMNAAEFWDTRLIAASEALAPAWVRFPSGTLSDVYDWTSGNLITDWISSFDAEVKGSGAVTLLTDVLFADAVPLTRGKGFVTLDKFVPFANALDAATIVCVNGYTDTPTSAGAYATSVLSQGLTVKEWEIGNEPYLYTALFPTSTSYADAMKPYAQQILAVDPSAVIGLFWAGLWSGGDASWNDGYATYADPYWNAISIHLYPITESSTPIDQAIAVLNGVLAHGTVDYVASQLVPTNRPDLKVFVTEVNASGATNPISTTIFDGVFLVEYVARMSTSANVQGVGTHVLYASNTQQTGLIRAANDHDSDVVAAYKAGTTIDTASLDFGYYASAPGLALQVANVAFNTSTASLATTVAGGGEVPANNLDGGAGAPIPSVYAQAYMGAGKHHLVVTNKSSTAESALLQVDGASVLGTLQLSTVSADDPSLANVPGATSRVQIVASTSTGAIPIPAYSVTRVDW